MLHGASYALPYELNEKYILTELLGEGGFACVYKASVRGDSRLVAIKVLSKSVCQRPMDKERLQRELDVMAFVRDDHIVNLLDFFEDASTFFIVMDLCKGGSLYDYIFSKSKHIPEHIMASIFREIVTAIQICHNHNVAHRDLKLQNVLITDFPHIKVSDFGLCGYARDDLKLKTCCGSPCYMAPEVLENKEYNGKLADLWSLGVILYELITGQHPWNTSNAMVMITQIRKCQYTIPAGVPDSCADLIQKLLKPRPCERLQCEAILKHSWLSCAVRKQPSGLPPLKGLGVDLRTLEMKESIISPFKRQEGSAIPQLNIGAKTGNTASGGRAFRSGRLMVPSIAIPAKCLALRRGFRSGR